MTALALVLAGISSSASAQILPVSTDVMVDTTWCAVGSGVTDVVLQQPIFVRQGRGAGFGEPAPVVPPPTLTINEGCIVRGQPRSAAVTPGVIAGTPGALVVTQTGKVRILGAETNPVIFTTAAVDNDANGIADDVDAPIGFEDEWVAGDRFLDDQPKTLPMAPLDRVGNQNAGLWGGLVILGRAPTNLGAVCATGLGTCTVEGMQVPGFPAEFVKYGGVESHDSSGEIHYVSVRHGGDELGQNNELNGITLGGVGDGTIFEFAEVYANFDDGIEWFGGTVSGNNLVAVAVGDDAFDLDQGYTGVNQFLFGIGTWFNENDGGAFGTDRGDKICEFDGDDFNETGSNVNLVGPPSLFAPNPLSPWPLSSAFTYNLTGIGSTPDTGAGGSAVDFAPVSDNPDNVGCNLRNGFAGEVRNSIIVNTGTARALDVGAGGAPGFDTITNNIVADYDLDGNGDLVRVYCSVFDDTLAMAAEETTALTNGDVLAAVATDNNTVNTYSNLSEEDQTFDPTGTSVAPLGKLTGLPVGANGLLNPRPAAAGSGGCAGPTAPGTDPNAIYRGAFIRTAVKLWTTDWTVLNISGLMAD
jgi:hypothetical protein